MIINYNIITKKVLRDERPEMNKSERDQCIKALQLVFEMIVADAKDDAGVCLVELLECYDWAGGQDNSHRITAERLARALAMEGFDLTELGLPQPSA